MAIGEARRCPAKIFEWLEAGHFLVTLGTRFHHVQAAVLGKDNQMIVDENQEAVSGRPRSPDRLSGGGVDTSEEPVTEAINVAFVI